VMRLYRIDTNEPVELPADLVDFRGATQNVLAIAEESSPGRSGKIRLGSQNGAGARDVYPGVVKCYIAAAPREGLEGESAA